VYIHYIPNVILKLLSYLHVSDRIFEGLMRSAVDPNQLCSDLDPTSYVNSDQDSAPDPKTRIRLWATMFKLS
jgi:hypothetical protein